LRTCEDSVFSNRTRPCLLYQIKRCSGPCIGQIGRQAYEADVKNAELFLQGKQTEVMEVINAKMLQASERMEYEQAALLRDQIQALRRIREKQFVDSGKALDADVVACVQSPDGSGKVCVNLAMIRGGRHLGDKSFFPQNADDYSATNVLEAFLAQHYLNRSAPPLIILGEKIEREALQQLLTEQCGHKITIQLNPIGEKRVWLNMAAENAQLALKQMMSRQASQEKRLHALQQELNMPGIQRIECFDISHTLGEATVASCVVYDNFAADYFRLCRDARGADPALSESSQRRRAIARSDSDRRRQGAGRGGARSVAGTRHIRCQFAGRGERRRTQTRTGTIDFSAVRKAVTIAQ
jgi:excinuclease ABC subunit C